MWSLPAQSRTLVLGSLWPVQFLTSRNQANRPLARSTTPEDWRVLRLLSLYRMLLVILLLVLFETGAARSLFEGVIPDWFQWTCRVYALVALGLIWLVYRRQPSVTAQAQVHFFCDAAVLTALLYGAGGVSSGLGALLITPTVGCSMLLSTRLAALQAAIATLAIFAEEFFSHSPDPLMGNDLTGAGVLGLMLFGSSLGSNLVAQRALASEALARRVGSEFESLSRLSERIIRSMQTGVAVVDAQGHLRIFNTAAEQLLDTADARASSGLPLQDIHAELHQRWRDWRARLPTVAAPLSARSGQGELIPRFSPLGDGPEASTLILLEDASVLRQQAQQIKLAGLGRLSASIAHEIRNPLSAISHASQLMAETPALGSENQRLLQMIQHHSGRIDKIVNDVLSLSRRAEAVRGSIPLRDWLTRTAALYQEMQLRRGRPIELTYVPDNLVVGFDANHLQQVLFNLWDNAFEHGGADGRSVTVILRIGWDAPDRPWLDISDDGPGVPENLREQMFEPFFTTRHGGTGLGLYLVRELCEYNQSSIRYITTGKGACFRMTFTAETT